MTVVLFMVFYVFKGVFSSFFFRIFLKPIVYCMAKIHGKQFCFTCSKPVWNPSTGIPVPLPDFVAFLAIAIAFATQGRSNNGRVVTKNRTSVWFFGIQLHPSRVKHQSIVNRIGSNKCTHLISQTSLTSPVPPQCVQTCGSSGD